MEGRGSRGGGSDPRQMSVLKAVIQANEEGNRAFCEGRLEEAAAAYERAVAALRPGQVQPARTAYENLGLAYFNLGRYHEAMRAFLRALDGKMDSREQSLRFLTSSAAYLGRCADGIRYLRGYEQAFGPHPDGWTLQMLEGFDQERRRSWAVTLAC
ncbi:MAG: tetratricopeptide repeat protein [Bradymonadales bacterium]|nr:tetratricopeptide repeat protein [Bradymonadales bacterium]